MNQEGFEVAAGTVPGRDHIGHNGILIGKNNQDWFSVSQRDDCLVAVVTDGCSQGLHSEVGAKLGAKLIVRAIRRALVRVRSISGEDALLNEHFWERVRADVLAQIHNEALQLTEPEDSFTQTIKDYFQFTVVGVLVAGAETTIFSIGDGVYQINGETVTIGPFPGNKPPYLSYSLIDTEFERDSNLLRFQLETRATRDLDSIIIGTDGVSDLIRHADSLMPGGTEVVGPLSQFLEEDRFFENPDAIRRRLSLVNREVIRMDHGNSNGARLTTHNGLLRDDTTLIAIRKVKQQVK